MFLALRAKQMGKCVGFMSMLESDESYFDDAVHRFCGMHGIDFVDKTSLWETMYIYDGELDEALLATAVSGLEMEYDCIFIDEIPLESYHLQFKNQQKYKNYLMLMQESIFHYILITLHTGY